MRLARDESFHTSAELENGDSERKLSGTDTSTMVINPTYLAQRTRQCMFSSSN